MPLRTRDEKPRLSPRRRVALYTLTVYLCALAFGWSMLSTVFINSYAKLERSEASANVMWAADAVRSRFAAIDQVATDWAEWDATWNFMRTRNRSFVDENATEKVMEDLRLNVMALIDNDGNVIFSRVYDLSTHATHEPAANFFPSVMRNRLLFEHTGAAHKTYGVIATSSGPMLVSARAILNDEGEGPVRGTLLFGRSLDEEITDFSREGVEELAVYPMDSPRADISEASRQLLAGETTSVSPVDETTISAFTALRSVYGEQAAILGATRPRAIYAKGRSTAAYLFLVAAVFGGFAASVIGYLIDRLVASLVARQASERAYSEFVENSSEGIILARLPSLRILQGNAAVAKLLGLPQERFFRARLYDTIPLPTTQIHNSMAALEPGGRAILGEVNHTRPDGSHVDLEISASHLAWDGIDVVCIAVRDVTERRREEERTRHIAFHDPLTGLPNRSLFQDRLKQALHAASRNGGLLGVGFIDLDQFKEVNDTFGHDTADRLLVDVSRRLQATLRDGDTVARQGGDEFLLLLPSLRTTEDATARIERVLEAIREPFNLDGREIHISSSVGLALYPHDGVDATTLVKNADMAMYQAKEAGRDNWQIFDARMQDRASRVIDVRTRLAHAIEREEFRLHYQPQVDLLSGQVVAVEALIRWESPEGPVAPMDFIPVAEQTGLIVPIGEWVLRTACHQARQWQIEGLPPVRVAVNMSARQFAKEGILQTVRRALEESDLAPIYLELEITETLAMRNPDVTRRILEEIREMGVTVALDDFGTGYSSLGYLRQFPIDRLKIDRSFLMGASQNGQHRAIVAAIIALSHALGLEVIAEGVEIAEQLELLIRDGCDGAQGYGLCRPVPAEQCGALLRADTQLLRRLLDRSRNVA